MAHFALLWKARTIETHRQNYENEKINSILLSNADIPDKTLLQRWRHYRYGVQNRLSRTFSRWYPEDSTVSNFFVHFRNDMKFPHIMIRSMFGFAGGLILTYLCFVFLVFQLSLSLMHATVFSSLYGVLITIGLTFSNRIRCLVFLLIPQLFSKAGRYTLTCYALVLILTGPATNTLKNSEVLSESMACSQEQIKTTVREINELSKKPYNSISESIKLIVEQMKLITAKLKVALLRISRLILSIASLIQSNFSWLGTVAQSCNKNLGTPYNRCISSLKSSIDGCKECDQPWYTAVVSISYAACSVLKPYEKFCIPADFAGETFYATVKKKLTTFTNRLIKVLYLKIRTHHSYTFIGNASSPSQVTAGIVTEIRNRADKILTWLSWSSCVTSMFLMLIIFRAKYYQYMYETKPRFDNRYITKEFRDLDLKRLREGRETVLPLTKRERAKYVTTTSFRLVASEKVYLNRSAVFMTITTFKLLIHIVADYSLYWVLMTIRYHGSTETLPPVLRSTGVRVSGNGFVSRLLQSLINTFDIPLQTSSVPNSCLPNPHHPDFKRYCQIGTLIFLLWFFALFEPYGLRLRHLIMGHYKPERAKARSIWLYNHILRTRGNFMKFARRKLHREYKHSSGTCLTFQHWIRSLVPFQWFQCLFGLHIREDRCLVCKTLEDSEDINSKLIRCAVINCPGIYCSSCFYDIGKMCTICLRPADYGDLSDVSLEKGSSDEDYSDDGDRLVIGNLSEENTHLYSSPTNRRNKSPAKYASDDTQSPDGSNIIDYEISTLLRQLNENQRKDYRNVMKSMFDENSILINVVKTPQPDDDIIMYTQNLSMLLIEPLFVKQAPLTFYSFYTIEVNNMYLVVTKNGKESGFAKAIKKKVKTVTKIMSMKHLKTCNNDKRENIARQTQDNARQINDTRLRDTDKKKDDIQRTQSTKKRENIKDKSKKSKSCNLNNATLGVCGQPQYLHVNRFYELCSKYWKTITNALFCVDIFSNTNMAPTEKKKHKRKKKHKETKDDQNSENEEMDPKDYVISAYLADQDWKKNQMIKVNDKIHQKTEIEVNHIMIPRLNLCFSSESLSYQNEEKIDRIAEAARKIKYENRKNFTIGALDRFFKKISRMSLSPNSSTAVTESGKKEIDTSLSIYNYDISMPRSMKYFKSLGNKSDKPGDRGSCNNEVKKVSERSLKINSESNEFSQYDEKRKGGEAEDPLAKTIKIEPHSKTSVEDLTKKWSGMMKRFQSPMSIVRDLYTTIFNVPDEEATSDIESKTATADKGINAYPAMQSCGCQNVENVATAEDRFTQVERSVEHSPKNKEVCDVQVNAVRPTCTCATQYYITRRDVGTMRTREIPRKSFSGINYGKCSDSKTDSDTQSDDSKSSWDSGTITTKSDDAKTDSTVCSLATIDMRYENRLRKRTRVKVVTKLNQSTLTDKASVCDVSTVTQDWWSPIVEKKVFTKEVRMGKKDGIIATKRKERMVTNIVERNTGTTTHEKIVTFRSREEIISTRESELRDILTPYRFLLESQKHYNELFSLKIYAPQVFPVSRILKHKTKPRSSVSSRHRSLRRSHSKKTS